MNPDYNYYFNTNTVHAKDHCLINHATLCQYLFKVYAKYISILIDDGHGWRTYDCVKAEGNYDIAQARTFWNGLVRQGFTTQYIQVQQ